VVSGSGRDSVGGRHGRWKINGHVFGEERLRNSHVADIGKFEVNNEVEVTRES